MDQSGAVGVAVAAIVAVAVGVAEGSAVGSGVVIATADAVAGRACSSSATPPPLSAGTNVGVLTVGGVAERALTFAVTAAATACGPVSVAGNSADLVQPARNMATSSSREMFIVLIDHLFFGSGRQCACQEPRRFSRRLVERS